jgi:YVTN family beta-propeller protein
VRVLCLSVVVLALAAGSAHAREVVVVANAEGGTVSVVDARSFAVLKQINVLPDGERAALGQDDPAQALAGQHVVEAAGGRNFAQDQDLSPDGRTLYVSRGHRGDVAAFDLRTGAMRWKVPIPGVRSDHMTISEDGSRLYVSALTDNRVHVVDVAQRRIVGAFATGEWPHDNHLSHDGKRVFNGSIGNIVTPSETRAGRPGVYRLTIADATTLQVLRTIDFDRGIRPYVLDHDETRMFAQLSEFHGVAEIDLRRGAIVRRRELPVDPGVTEEDYDFEAPHHGLALSPDESTLCAAGRASDYVALLSARDLSPLALIEVDDAPGWAATSPDGRHCFVANARADTLSVISYAERREVARVRMGDGPKQIEAARIPDDLFGGAAAAGTPRPALRLTRRCVGRGRLRVRVTGSDALGRVEVLLGDRRVARLARAPYERVLSSTTLARTRARRVRARTGSGLVLARSLPRCGVRPRPARARA